MATNDGNNCRTGRCCAGEFCVVPTQELCNRHKCIKCKKIVHILCGQLSTSTDEITCKKCVVSPYDEPPPPPRAKTPTKQSQPPSQRATRPCPACGGLDHQRKSSKKCKFYNKKTSLKTTSNSTSINVDAVDTTTTHISSTPTIISNCTMASESTTNNEETMASNTNDENNQPLQSSPDDAGHVDDADHTNIDTTNIFKDDTTNINEEDECISKPNFINNTR